MTGPSLAPLIIPIAGHSLPHRVADPGVLRRPPPAEAVGQSGARLRKSRPGKHPPFQATAARRPRDLRGGAMTIDYLPWNRPVTLADRVCMRDTQARVDLRRGGPPGGCGRRAVRRGRGGPGRRGRGNAAQPGGAAARPAGRVAAGRRGHPGQPGIHAERGGLPDRRLRGQADDRHSSGRQVRRPGAGGRRPRHHACGSLPAPDTRPG